MLATAHGSGTINWPPAQEDNPMISRRLMLTVVISLLGVTTIAAAEPLPSGAVARLEPPSRRGNGAIDGVAVSPDGRLLIAVGDSRRLHSWDLTTGKERYGSGTGRDALAVAVSPDGKVVAAGSWGHDANLYDAGTGERRSSLPGHAGAVT